MEVKVEWVNDARKKELELNAVGEEYEFLSVKCFTENVDEALRFHKEMYKDIFQKFNKPCSGILYTPIIEVSYKPYCEDCFFFKDVDCKAVIGYAQRYIRNRNREEMKEYDTEKHKDWLYDLVYDHLTDTQILQGFLKYYVLKDRTIDNVQNDIVYRTHYNLEKMPYIMGRLEAVIQTAANTEGR